MENIGTTHWLASVKYFFTAVGLLISRPLENGGKHEQLYIEEHGYRHCSLWCTLRLHEAILVLLSWFNIGW